MSTETTMQLLKLDFAPGFHRESTQYAEQGKWYGMVIELDIEQVNLKI